MLRSRLTQRAVLPSADIACPNIVGLRPPRPEIISSGCVRLDWYEFDAQRPTATIEQVLASHRLRRDLPSEARKKVLSQVLAELVRISSDTQTPRNPAIREIAREALQYWTHILGSYNVRSWRTVLGPVARPQTSMPGSLGKAVPSARLFSYAHDAEAHEDEDELGATCLHEAAHASAGSHISNQGEDLKGCFGWYDYPVIEEVTCALSEGCWFEFQGGRPMLQYTRVSQVLKLEDSERLLWTELSECFARDLFLGRPDLKQGSGFFQDRIFFELREHELAIDYPMWEFGSFSAKRFHPSAYAVFAGAFIELQREIYPLKKHWRESELEQLIPKSSFRELLVGQHLMAQEHYVNQVRKYLGQTGIELLQSICPYTNYDRNAALFTLFVLARHLRPDRSERARKIIVSLAMMSVESSDNDSEQ